MYFNLTLQDFPYTVTDPDLQIRGGGGGGNPDPEIRGVGWSPKNVWSKNKGGAPRAPPLDPPLL